MDDVVRFSCSETKLFLGAKFIMEACKLLGLSYHVKYKSLVLFYNFSEDVEFVNLCTSSILLASKLEEEECTLKKVIYVFNYLYTEYQSKPVQLTNRSSIRLREGCVSTETMILKSFGFNIVFEDVYGSLVDFLNELSISKDMVGKIFSSFNTLMIWPGVIRLNSESMVIAAVKLAFGVNEAVEKILKKYEVFEKKKFDLETYEEICTVWEINHSLFKKFAGKRKKSF